MGMGSAFFGGLIVLAGAVSGVAPAYAQTPATPAQAAGPSVREPALRDTGIEAGETLIGRALFLRGFYAGGDLTYDAQGHITGQPKVVDWTLAGFNVEKVLRKSPTELELNGTRVAMRYNPDQHVFERHPLKDEKVKILVAELPDGRGLQAALSTIFSVGIDPALQRSMPVYWRRYFSPASPWPNDDLTGQTIIPSNYKAGEGVEAPVLEKKLEPEFTLEAKLDHVKGSVLVRMVVGTDGVARRITIRQPLGYGLDAKVAETAAKYRFHPGTQNGKPVAVEMLVNQTFDLYLPPGR